MHTNADIKSTHFTLSIIIFSIFFILCQISSSHAQTPYYVLYGYNTTDCSGTPLSYTVVNTSCNPAGESHPFSRNSMVYYEYSECTESGLKIFSCSDSDCNNCTEEAQSYAINTCSSGNPSASSQTRCEMEVPSYPQANYRTLTTFTNDGCTGDVRGEYFEQIVLDSCSYVSGWVSYYAKDVCSTDGTYTRLRCSDSACANCSPLNIMSGCTGASNISCLHAVPATPAPTSSSSPAPTASSSPTAAPTPSCAASSDQGESVTPPPVPAGSVPPTQGHAPHHTPIPAHAHLEEGSSMDV